MTDFGVKGWLETVHPLSIFKCKILLRTMQERNSIFLPERGWLCSLHDWYQQGSNRPPNLSPTRCPLCCFKCSNFIALCFFSALSCCHRSLQFSSFAFSPRPAHQVSHFHFPILCILALFSAHNPFLLPGQWIHLPAPPQTLHFLSFFSGT